MTRANSGQELGTPTELPKTEVAKMHDKDKMGEDRRGMLIGGVITIGVGIVFLLESLDVIPGLGQSWPLFPIVVGIALIVGSLIKGKGSDRPAKPPE